MRKLIAPLAIVFLISLCGASETEVFRDVKIHRHRSAQDRVLVDKIGILTFDDLARKFIFEKRREDRLDTPEIIEVPYDAVTTVVFERTNHMHGVPLAWTPFAAGGGLGGLIATSAVARKHISDFWFYVEYRSGEDNTEVLLEVPKDSSQGVIDKASSLFGSKVSITQFQEEGKPVEQQKLPDFKSKHLLHIDKQNRPVPELKKDKATVVVVCPPVAPHDSGKGNQFKLHANDRVIAVNKEGTYSFAYLDPGKYRLISQSENANGFEMELEAGKTYYFLQNTFQGLLKNQTALSRNSPELVNFLMTGTYFSDWARQKQ
jgi:hypothetical protein